MDQKKRISINTDLFSMNKTKKKKEKKEKVIKQRNIIKPTNMKKELIKKIKQKQSKLSEKPIQNLGVDDNDFENDFMSSMQALDNIIKEEKEKKQRKTVKNKRSQENNSLPIHPQPIVHTQPQPIINTSVPVIKTIIPEQKSVVPIQQTPLNTKQLELKPEPDYGCLRNGKKPCYREFHNKTLKKNTKRRIKKNKIKKTKYTLGKTPKNRSVSILIKNNQTRRRIQQDFTKLKKTHLSEIKHELFKKNLIKMGTSCPPDVIRTIYEQSMLAGDINNTSSNVSLHNFLNKD
jgi:hypothetical protein